MGNPLVSVAMATFNGEKYLEAQLESIFRQDYQPIEIVVSDDCSTDGTLAILNKYAKAGKLHYWRNEQNLGYVKNFENALLKCSGAYVALADQDDVWDREKVSRLCRSIGSSLLIHSDARLIDEGDEVLSESFSRFSKKMTLPSSLIDASVNGSVTGCTSLVARPLLDLALPMPSGVYVHDKWLALLAYSQRGLAYLDETLIGYRQHGGNSIGVAEVSETLLEKMRKTLKRGSIDFQLEAFRDFVKKEQGLLSALCDRVRLEVEDRKAAEALDGFYSSILAGNSLGSVVFFYFQHIVSFEKNKTMSQKIYFLYLILNTFFYSRTLHQQAQH